MCGAQQVPSRNRLTSPARRAWVDGQCLHDDVLDYGELDRLAAPGGTVLIDFAGDRDLLRRAHHRLGGSLRRSILVGFTRTRMPPGDDRLPGPPQEFFFAP